MAYKMKRKHKDFPYKTPVGPVANKKKIDRIKKEEENRIAHNVEAKMDYVRGIFHPEYIKKKRNGKRIK